MGYRGSKERNLRMKKLCDKTGGDTSSGAWFDPEKKRYIRYYGSNTPGYKKLLRRMSNRKVRRYGDALNNGRYRKVYDYWWILH